MKKLFTFILALLAIVRIWAQTFTVDNLKYEITDETTRTAKLIGYETEPTGILNIPSTISIKNIEYSVTSIGNMAFTNCIFLTQATIPNSVINIGDVIFFNCSALTQISVDNENPAYSSIDGVLFNKDKTTLIKFPEGKTTPTYTIPHSVTHIEHGGLRNCSALKEIIITKNVNSIYDEGFLLCLALTQITVENENAVYCSENGILFNKNKTTLIQFPVSKIATVYEIPNSVTNIGTFAFDGCKFLTQVTIPISVTNIGMNAFARCPKLTQINVDSENTTFCSENGILFNKDKTTLIQYPIGKKDSVYTIPNSVINIGANAFSNNIALTQIIISKNVENIEFYAFSGCTALKEMTVWAITPPYIQMQSLGNFNYDIPVYVPEESLEKYKIAVGWNELNNLKAISSTALHTTSMPKSISVCNGILCNPQSLSLRIYDMQGHLIYNGNNSTVYLSAGIYVVKCLGTSYKVMF